MAKNRTNRLMIRCNDELLKAIEILQEQYPNKTKADIIHMAVAKLLRGAAIQWNMELEALANKLK